ncbi:MAG: PAS domain-containing protein, partial [Betaproteobacteria bacterium]
MTLKLPQSLTAQFSLVVSCLALLVVVVGVTAVWSLDSSARDIRALADQRLARVQDAQELGQRTLLIERLALQLPDDDTVGALHETNRQVIEQLEAFDRLVDRLAAGGSGDDLDVLALHRSSQNFRNTVNIVANLRETALDATGATAATTRPEATLAGLEDDLQRQSDALALAARKQSDYFTRDYRGAVQHLAEVADRTRWLVGAEVGMSLVLAWLIARTFLGRHVVARLRRVSQALRHGGVGSPGGAIAVHGGDEIADMARAVEQFIEDRRQRRQAEDALQQLNADLEMRVAQRTSELSTALAGRDAEIAERQQAEEAVRASEHFLNNIVENIPDMIFVKEAASLRMVRFNKAGEELLGYRRDELIGKHVHELFPPEEADFFTLKDRAVLDARQMVDVPEEPVHTRHGTRLLHTMKIPLLDVHGEPQFLLGISRDITEQKR